MTNKVKPIPDGYHTITPYMMFEDAVAAIAFYQKAFGATEVMRIIAPSTGLIRHAEIKIGNSSVMLANTTPKFPEMGSAKTLGGSPISLFLYVEDVDAFVAQAVAAGATQIETIKNHEEGDRRGGVQDPFGYTWWVATHIEDVPLETLIERTNHAKL